MKELKTIKAKEVEVSEVCQRYGLAYYCKANGWQIVYNVHTTPESALEEFNRMNRYNHENDDYKCTHYSIFELTLQNPLFL